MLLRQIFEAKDFSSESFEATIEGKKYKVEVDNTGDEEVNKRWVDVTLPDGKKQHVDWSPYSKFTQADLTLWVKCGMPDRKTIKSVGPLRSEDLKKLSNEAA